MRSSTREENPTLGRGIVQSSDNQGRPKYDRDAWKSHNSHVGFEKEGMK
jgi:hypothetical protein